MERKTVSVVMLTLLSISMLTLAFNIQPVKAQPKTWIVDDDGPADFHTIQEAINHANSGDTIFVRAGIYNESPSLWLTDDIAFIGENSLSTIINGSFSSYYGHGITVMNFEIRGTLSLSAGFTEITWGIRVENNVLRSGVSLGAYNSIIKSNFIEGGLSITGGYHWSPSGNLVENNTFLGSGIDMSGSGGTYMVITRNTIINASIGVNGFGDEMYFLEHNSITENHFIQCGIGVHLSHMEVWWNDNKPLPSCSIISGNTFEGNDYGISLEKATNVSIHHNNFINNAIHAFTTESYNNSWDDGYPSGGNYWSDYTGADVDEDGIGDTPYFIDENNQDRYPLTEPWSAPTQTKTLIRTVWFWNLPKGTENSLTSKLEDALHLLDIGNENGATHKLMDFINQVEVLRGKKLTNEQADYLVSEAERIIDLINERSF